MINENTKQIFIGDGAGPDADATSAGALTKQINIVGNNMKTANQGGQTVSTAGYNTLYFVNKYSDGTYKYSNPIEGYNVISYKAESYAPATRCVAVIGYDRSLATGLIEVNNDTEYEFNIKFKNDKTFYSERGEFLRGTFRSTTTDTESTIATTITNLINNSSFGSQPSGIKVVKAVKVGNNTGAYGLTGATHYGVEIWGLDINQFANTTYSNKLVSFTVGVNDSIGFGPTTTCTQIQGMSYGTGTYDQIYNTERETSFNEGRLNAKLFPIPDYKFLSSSTGTLSGTLAAFTATGTSTEDKVTFSAAASTQLPAGSSVVFAGDTTIYKIKYWVSTTVAILDTVLVSNLLTAAVTAYAWYDVFNIVVRDVTTTPGANIGAFSKKVIMVAVPAISTTATSMQARGTELLAIKNTLNTWMSSTPLAPTAVSI